MLHGTWTRWSLCRFIRFWLWICRRRCSFTLQITDRVHVRLDLFVLSRRGLLLLLRGFGNLRLLLWHLCRRCLIWIDDRELYQNSRLLIIINAHLSIILVVALIIGVGEELRKRVLLFLVLALVLHKHNWQTNDHTTNHTLIHTH